jgi:hypothetical protein
MPVALQGLCAGQLSIRCFIHSVHGSCTASTTSTWLLFWRRLSGNGAQIIPIADGNSCAACYSAGLQKADTITAQFCEPKASMSESWFELGMGTALDRKQEGSSDTFPSSNTDRRCVLFHPSAYLSPHCRYTAGMQCPT